MQKLFLYVLFLRTFSCIATDIAPTKDNNNMEGVNLYYYPSMDSAGILLDYSNSSSLSLLREKTFTVIVIDGFLSNLHSGMTETVKNGLLKFPADWNVIVLDWSALSGSSALETRMDENTPFSYVLVLYNQVRQNVELVAKILFNFLVQLKDSRGISFSNVHLIGFSLGAHVAGVTGLYVIKNYNDKIARITALDPAGPGFSLDSPHSRLDKGDADFVDVYFTNRYFVGDTEHDVGHADVFVNGGSTQPGCDFTSLVAATKCNHAFSWMVWNMCLLNPCIACPCHELECQNCSGICKNGVEVGMRIDKNIRGSFYLRTERVQ